MMMMTPTTTTTTPMMMTMTMMMTSTAANNNNEEEEEQQMQQQHQHQQHHHLPPGAYTNIPPDEIERRLRTKGGEGGIKHPSERNPHLNPLCPNGHPLYHRAHPCTVAATNNKKAAAVAASSSSSPQEEANININSKHHQTACTVCHDTTLHADAIWFHCISKLCYGLQVNAAHGKRDEPVRFSR